MYARPSVSYRFVPSACSTTTGGSSLSQFSCWVNGCQRQRRSASIREVLVRTIGNVALGSVGTGPVTA